MSPTLITPYRLRLFIAGASPRSMLAVKNVRRICEVALGSRADLEIIDVYQQPDLAIANDIVAVPMLLKWEPAPLKRIGGMLDDQGRVMRGLGLAGPWVV